MNRLLLKECLDELRSDDSVELTESQKHPHGKKRNSPHHGNRAAPSLDGSSRGFPDSSRSTASSTPALTERRRQSIANVTNDVKRKILNYLNGDRKIDEKDYKRAIGDLRATFSLEYKGGSSYGPIATPSGIMGLRVADHRAVGEHFPQNEGDFYVSIYIGEGEAAHIPTAVPYKEFYCPKVLFDRNPKKVLRAAVGIVLNAIETGELVDKTATFTMKDYPVEVPQGAQAAIPTQAGLSPQPPATPPTEPGVQESFFSRFSNLDYLYRILDEGKDSLIDRLPSLDDAQKTQMKQFFAKRPSLESKFDWNKPDTITWDAFQSIANEYEDPIDPDTVPEFSDKRDEGSGIVSYQVQNDKYGQRAVRRIVDTHWGKNDNPWCLINRWQDSGMPMSNKDELDDAFLYWEDQYCVYPKRVAFKNGKLLALRATDVPADSDFSMEMMLKLKYPELCKQYMKNEGDLVPLNRFDEEHPEEFEDAGCPVEDLWWDRMNHPHIGLDWAR